MRMLRRRSAESAKVPGTTARLAISDHTSAGGHRFAMIHSRATQHVTVVFQAGARDLARWTELFGLDGIQVRDSVDITAITAVTETQPLAGEAQRRWLAADAADELVALRMDLLDVTEIALTARLAVTFDVLVRRAQKDLSEQGVEIGRRLPRLIESFAEAGIAVRPMSSVEVVAVVSAAYSETSADTFADAFTGDLRERRDVFAHNGFRTAAAVMAPARARSDVIEALCTPSWTAARGRVAVTYRREVPAAGRAARLARMGVVVTVTEPSAVHPSLEAKRTGLPLAGRLALRRGYDAQAALMAASLGVGVLLPEHADITDVAI
ncbi:hypothetical protein FOS14_19495 [Skermania sp. ID1734]|uniref:SCO6880 family protein n=1 Tax=Skermania sp. ID1734 TaxID=2597516 RepID=UPI0011805E3D|nr:SCO6880 family protein [Skermania sp. ID1734]TSD94829.1 hypothetical protein FOS14_19495 [Skermania sp. ID1734]